jgi:hypothetical protein
MIFHIHRDPNWHEADWGWRLDRCKCGKVRVRRISNLAAPGVLGLDHLLVNKHGQKINDSGWVTP